MRSPETESLLDESCGHRETEVTRVCSKRGIFHGLRDQGREIGGGEVILRNNQPHPFVRDACGNSWLIVGNRDCEQWYTEE